MTTTISAPIPVQDFDEQIAGEETVPRSSGLLDYNNTNITGFQTFNFFTAKTNSTVTTAKFETGSAGTTTPTLVRVGLYLVDPVALGLTLVASTANDTTLASAAYTGYSKALSSPYTFVRGSRYAASILVVAAVGCNMMGPYTIQRIAVSPRRAAVSGGSLADLPSTISDASIQDYRFATYIAFT